MESAPAPADGKAPAGILSIEKFLELHPWPSALADGARPLDFLWHWELEAGTLELWPHLIDTSSFNKRLGLPEMHYVEKGGRLHGWAVNAGVRLEWEEVPWEWEYGKGLNTTRLYSKGFARCVRARYVLEELGPRRARLYVYFGWVPRGLLGRLIIPPSMNWVRKRYEAVLGEIVESIRGARPPAPVSPPPVLSPEAERELSEIERRLLRERLDAGLVRRVADLIREAPDEQLLRVRPRALARKWGVRERDLLAVFLHSTREGAFVLSWDVICPHCRGVRRALGSLGDIPKSADCEPCGIDFAATGLNSLEATFRVHPSLRKVEQRTYCAAEPATKPHILLQKAVPPGQLLPTATLLREGRYRLRVKGAKEYGLLDVAPGAPSRLVEWKAGAAAVNRSSQPLPTLVLDNGAEAERVFVVEEAGLDADALRPVDLFCFQDFRDLFSEQAIATDIQLEIGVQTVLFTDLVGSTRFYHTVGDAAAFTQVREHFVKVFDVVRRRNGAVVKTIGDAAMGAFEQPSDALLAALELQEHFNDRSRATQLRIRISLNTGPCLAVNLNSNIDYFGNTVNLAAKLQAAVDAQQIVFTETVRSDPGVALVLRERSLPFETLEFEMKWTDGGTIPAYRITV